MVIISIGVDPELATLIEQMCEPLGIRVEHSEERWLYVSTDSNVRRCFRGEFDVIPSHTEDEVVALDDLSACCDASEALLLFRLAWRRLRPALEALQHCEQ
jgi:hypothetical protein